MRRLAGIHHAGGLLGMTQRAGGSSGPTLPVLLSEADSLWWAERDVYQDDALSTPAAALADPVGGWKDQRAGAFHQTQSTGALRPTYMPDSGFKSRPCVKFV